MEAASGACAVGFAGLAKLRRRCDCRGGESERRDTLIHLDTYMQPTYIDTSIQTCLWPFTVVFEERDIISKKALKFNFKITFIFRRTSATF